MTPLRVLNELVRFVLEVGALAALGWWGWRAGAPGWPRWALAIGAPSLAALAWGLFAAPRSVYDLPAARVAVQLAVLAAAVAALVALGRPALGVAFVVVALANAALLGMTGRLAP